MWQDCPRGNQCEGRGAIEIPGLNEGWMRYFRVATKVPDCTSLAMVPRI